MMALQVERENVWRRAWSEVKTGQEGKEKKQGRKRSREDPKQPVQIHLAFADGEENIIS